MSIAPILLDSCKPITQWLRRGVVYFLMAFIHHFTDNRPTSNGGVKDNALQLKASTIRTLLMEFIKKWDKIISTNRIAPTGAFDIDTDNSVRSAAACSTIMTVKKAPLGATCSTTLLLLLYTFMSLNLSAQPNWISKIDSFKQPLKVVPVISANSLIVDTEQNILLLDQKKSLIYKYLTMTDYDSSIVIGGKGKGREAITQATKMSMPNRQQLYILDEAQSRLLLMNTNFKLLKDFDFLELGAVDAGQEELEIYPQSFSINSFSELFVLNQLDAKVYQFDAKNELVRQFGGLDYGAGSLSNPVDVQAHIDQRVYVSDTTAQSITVFSNYGLYLYTLSSDAIVNWKRFHLFEQYIIYVTPNSIYIQYLPTRELVHLPLALASPLLDVYFTNDFIFLLFEGAVYIYSITD